VIFIEIPRKTAYSHPENRALAARVRQLAPFLTVSAAMV